MKVLKREAGADTYRKRNDLSWSFKAPSQKSEPCLPPTCSFAGLIATLEAWPPFRTLKTQPRSLKSRYKITRGIRAQINSSTLRDAWSDSLEESLSSFMVAGNLPSGENSAESRAVLISPHPAFQLTEPRVTPSSYSHLFLLCPGIHLVISKYWAGRANSLMTLQVLDGWLLSWSMFPIWSAITSYI